jgi:Ser-tRNA(Ala) deacylase AlaX
LKESGKANFAVSKDPKIDLKKVENDENEEIEKNYPSSIDEYHKIELSKIPMGVESKADMIETIPLFLSDHYK